MHGPGPGAVAAQRQHRNVFCHGLMPDSQGFIFVGHEPGYDSRFYIPDTHSGTARPLTPERHRADTRVAISPDGNRFAAREMSSRAWKTCEVDPGASASIRRSDL